MVRTILALFIAFGATGIAAAADNDTLPSPDRLIRQFEATAFYPAPREPTLNKQRHPVRIYRALETEASDEPHRVHSARAADEIGREAATPISFVSTPDRETVEALIGGREFLVRRLTQSDWKT
ncbi:MAG: hypothetical protein EXQ91_07695 [Alphaproteobacteria bacterium]|nr:hypothetical protein [Alphaproteobacteria bacterium]